MDPLMMAVDIGAIVRDLASATAKRLEASKNLPETVARVKRTIGQVIGATEDVQLDKPTENALATIKLKLEEVNRCLDRLEKTNDRAAAKRGSVLGRCCGLVMQGQDVLMIEEEFDRLDEEIKAELAELVKATQLHAYANRAAGVLKDKSARAFWDRHFKDARSVSGDELLEALRHEVGPSVDMDTLEPIVRLALGCDDDTQQAQVTVLRFGETFGERPLTETLQQLAKRKSAASHLVQLRCYRLPSKKPNDAHSLALLMRVTDSLADLRHAVRKHAFEAVEEEGEQSVPSFLAKDSFELYLDRATTRVRRKQEAEMSGKAYLDRVCFVPSSDVPGAKKTLDAAKSAARAKTADSSSGAGSDDGLGTAAEDELCGSAAARIMEQSDARQAATLSISSAIADPNLSLSLRAHASRLGIGEAAVAFLSSLRELTAACAAVAPANVCSGARTRLATVGCEALAARYLREGHRKRLPPECEAAIAQSTSAKDAAAGDAEALLCAFEPVQSALEAALAPALDALRHEVARQRVRALKPTAGGGAARARVVVVGGGYAGSLIAADLSTEPDVFDVVLVDPKEYFEDVTAQPRSIVNPGVTIDGGEEGGSASWVQSVSRYKDFVVKNGQLVTGLLSGVRTAHVEVGPSRTAIPYDYLVLAMGTSYASDIKAENASLAFRHEQLRAERDAIGSAKHVLVVGGGLVGCEVAGEIAEGFPGKQVTLVHAHAQLLPNIRGAHELASGVLEGLGVKLILGQRVQRSGSAAAVAGGGGSFVTSAGVHLEADKVFWCTGYTPNSEALRDSQASDDAFRHALDERGFVRVDASLRVVGLENVFACGDIISSESRCAVFASVSDAAHGEPRPERTANAATNHAAVALENIRRLHAGRGESEIVRFDFRRLGNKANVAISLGKSMGVVAMDPTSFQVFEGFGLIGADFGADKAKIESEWISLAGGTTPFKCVITGMILSSKQSAEALAQAVGMGKTMPCFIDPRVEGNLEAWASAVETETLADSLAEEDDSSAGAALAGAPAGALPTGGGEQLTGGSVAGGAERSADTMTIGSDASALEIQSLRTELRKVSKLKESMGKLHEQEVVALRAELEAAKAIASAQIEEMRVRMQDENKAALSAMRAEMEEARQRMAADAALPNGAALPPPPMLPPPMAGGGGGGGVAAGATSTIMPAGVGLVPLKIPDDGAGGSAGIAIASAQMLLTQASAAANVIAALAATVRSMEEQQSKAAQTTEPPEVDDDPPSSP